MKPSFLFQSFTIDLLQKNNRTNMKTIKLLVLIGTISLNAVFAQESVQTIKGSALVLPQIQVIPIKDTQANRSYELYVELPEGYSENPDKGYPVLYYTDAIWHMEILSGCAEFILTDVILVGISWQKDINQALIDEHGIHVSRYRDYTVRKSTNEARQAKYEFGNAGNHLEFIRNDVIPFVEANYRTKADQRSYFGYSASGLFGAYILLSQPETFKNYILGSPSVDGDIPILSQIEADLNQEVNANVFVSYGTLEDELSSYGDQLIEMLEARKDKNLSLNYVKIEGDHSAAFPMTGVKSIKWLKELIMKGE